MRRSSRRATSAEPTASTSRGAADGEEEEDEAGLDEGIRRSSRLRHKPPMKMAAAGGQGGKDGDGESSTSEEEEDDGDNDDEEDEDDVSTRRNLRPRRTHREPQRFAYEQPVPMGRSSSRNRIGGHELRNLDQYSSEEEFQGGRDGGRRRRYNTRENRRPIRRYDASGGRSVERRAGRDDFRRGGGGGGGGGRSRNRDKKRVSYRERDTSSSSSSDDPDDARFEKRKAKRMAVERSKLMPLNFGKDDMRKSIFKVTVKKYQILYLLLMKIESPAFFSKFRECADRSLTRFDLHSRRDRSWVRAWPTCVRWRWT